MRHYSVDGGPVSFEKASDGTTYPVQDGHTIDGPLRGTPADAVRHRDYLLHNLDLVLVDQARQVLAAKP